MDARDRAIAERTVRKWRFPLDVRPTQEQLDAPLTAEEEEGVANQMRSIRAQCDPVTGALPASLTLTLRSKERLPEHIHAALVKILARVVYDGAVRHAEERERRERAATPKPEDGTE